LRGCLPPVDLRATCFVRTMVGGGALDGRSEQHAAQATHHDGGPASTPIGCL
jgi:hypothetical protein